MAHVLGICGSLRAGSLNAQLLEVVADQMPEGISMSTVKNLHEIPPFDAGLECGGPPPAVRLLRSEVRSADAVVVATPEYNHGMPGILHNMIDWLSRPRDDLPLTGKAAAVLVATRSPRLGVRGLAATRAALRDFGNIVVPGPEIVVDRAHEKLTRRDDGRVELRDEETLVQVRSLLAVLADLVHADVAPVLARSMARHVSGVWW